MMPSRGLQAVRSTAPRLYQQQCRNLSSQHSLPTSPLRYTKTSSIRTSQWRTQAPTAAFSLAAVRYASTTPTSSAPGPASAPQAQAIEPANAAPSSSQFPNLDTITLDDVQLAANSDLASLPETIGYLKSIGLDYGIGPTAAIEWILEHFHVWGGLPWWGAIAATAFLVRVAVFPFYLQAADQQARSTALLSITKPITERMNAAQKAGDQTAVMQAWADMKAVRKRAGLSYLVQFTPAMIQGVLGFCSFKLLRAAAALPVPGFQDGGFLWLKDLTLSDPYLLLPAIMAGSVHMMIRYGGETGSQGTEAMPEGMKRFMLWGMPGIIMLVTGWQSGAICVWFATGGALGLCQALLLQRPAVRQFVGIAPLYRPTKAEGPVPSSFDPITNYLKPKTSAEQSNSTTSGKNAAYMRPNYQAPQVRTTRSPHTIDATTTSSASSASPSQTPGPFFPHTAYRGSNKYVQSKPQGSVLANAKEAWKSLVHRVQQQAKEKAAQNREQSIKKAAQDYEERTRKKREMGKRR